jgi:hypothetical protein
MVDFAKLLKEKQTMARDKERKRKREDEDEETSASDIGKELQELESAWSEAEVQEGFGDLPDDTYQMKVTKAYLNKSKSSGRLQLTVEFTVATGKFKNRKKWSHLGIVDAQSLGFVKTLFARLKLDPPKKLAELNDEETLEKLLDITCECSVKTRGDFQNVYVNKLIDLDEEAEDADDWEPSNRSKKSKDEDEGDDEDEKPKKKRADDADEEGDEDEKPRKRDREEEDEDDEPPKKKSRRDEEDEDEDDEPKKKSKSEDEDEEDEDERPKKKRRDEDEDAEDDRPRKKSKF